MPIDIYGFVEVSNMDEAELDEPHMWMSCLALSCFDLLTDDICRILFGEAKTYIESKDWPPIAKGRGLPSNLAAVTTREAAVYQEFEAAGEPVWGYTYISYKELKQVKWETYAGADLEGLEKYGWHSLFKTMDTLAGHFAHQRLIVWFVW